MEPYLRSGPTGRLNKGKRTMISFGSDLGRVPQSLDHVQCRSRQTGLQPRNKVVEDRLKELEILPKQIQNVDNTMRLLIKGQRIPFLWCEAIQNDLVKRLLCSGRVKLP